IVQRVSGGAGGGAVGVRRVGGSEPGGVGGERSAAEFSAGPGGRSVMRGAGVSAVQRGMLQGAAICGRGEFVARGVGRGAAGCRAWRGHVGNFGDADFRAGVDEFLDSERRARALRDGARWNFFQDRRWHTSEIPHAGAGAAFSGSAGKRAGAERNVRGADQPVHFRGLDFLWAGGGGAVPVAPEGTGNGAAVPLLGVSVGARGVRVGRAGAHREFVAGAAGALDDWIDADTRGVAVLPVVGAQSGGLRIEQILAADLIEGRECLGPAADDLFRGYTGLEI